MGVIKPRKATVFINTEQVDSVELAQSEGVINEPFGSSITNPSNHSHRKRLPPKEEVIAPKKKAGRRKVNRYLNLIDLLERTEHIEDCFFFNFCKGPFVTLLELTENPEKLLNDFCEQQKGFEENIITKKNNYTKISYKIRKAMKSKKNFPSKNHREIECELISFFHITPSVVFKKIPPNSFERLFLHGLSKYHDLLSRTIIENTLKIVEVRCINDLWFPQNLLLCDLILKKKKQNY